MYKYACIYVCKSFFSKSHRPHSQRQCEVRCWIHFVSQIPILLGKKKNDGTTDFRKTAGGYANSTTFFTEFVILRTNRGVANLTLRVTFLSYDSYLYPLILRVRNFRASTSENKAEPVQEQPAKETFQTLRMSSLAHPAPKWPENSGGWVVLGMPFGVEKSPVVSLCSLFRGESCFFGILNCWWVSESNEECTICMHYFRIKSTVSAFPSFHAGWNKRVLFWLVLSPEMRGACIYFDMGRGHSAFPFVSLALLSE